MPFPLAHCFFITAHRSTLFGIASNISTAHFFKQQTWGITFSFCGKYVGVNSFCRHLKKFASSVLYHSWSNYHNVFSIACSEISPLLRRFISPSWHFVLFPFIWCACMDTPSDQVSYHSCFEDILIVSSLRREKSLRSTM